MGHGNVLSQELATFEKHKNELLAQSEGKYVLIYQTEVVGTYSSEVDAITEGYQRFGNVPLLVKRVVQIETPINFVNNNVGV